MRVQTETFEEVMHRVRRGRASLIVAAWQGSTIIQPVDELPEDEQRRLWREHGSFWIAGAPLEVNDAWVVTHWPDDDEARTLSALLLVPVVAYVSRPPSPRRHPRPKAELGWPGPTWH